jgi:hypothetical protein
MSEGPAFSSATGSSGRRPWLALVAAVAVISIAIAKPWGGDESVAEVPASPVAVATAAPSAGVAVPVVPPPPTAAQRAARSCNGTRFWMVFSLQRRGDQAFNVWTVADAVPAASADPLAMTYTRITATQLMGFGYCAPSEDELRPMAADAVTIWRVADGRSVVPMPAITLEPGLRPDFGALMAPSMDPGPTTGRPGWPAGRYLIRAGGMVLGAEVALG